MQNDAVMHYEGSKDYLFQRGNRFCSQNLTSTASTYKDGPRTERIKIFLMAVNP